MERLRYNNNLLCGTQNRAENQSASRGWRAGKGKSSVRAGLEEGSEKRRCSTCQERKKQQGRRRVGRFRTCSTSHLEGDDTYGVEQAAPGDGEGAEQLRGVLYRGAGQGSTGAASQRRRSSFFAQWKGGNFLFADSKENSRS